MVLNVYQKSNPRSVILCALSLILTVICLYFAFGRMQPGTYTFYYFLAGAIVFLIFTVFLFLRAMRRDVALYANEQGILSDYCFFIPWREIDHVYARPGDYSYFLEVKIKDSDKFLTRLDRDVYDAFADDLDDNLLAGHEMFSFELDALSMSSDEIVTKLNEMQKFYTK